MIELPAPDVLATATPVIRNVLHALGPTIRRGAGHIAKRVVDSAVANLQIGFAPYLHTSYERCRLIKTLISQDRPLSLHDIYVHLFLDCGDLHIIDDDLIQTLSSYRCVVITGLAGCGKSMFMKYLTICRFEHSNGKLPLFVELRQLNSQPS